jgi:ABC-type transport system involved in multi-copper enzyme maturation permease subunit
MIGLVLGIAILMGFAVKPSELTKDEHQRAMFGLGLAGGFIAALIGVMSICSEFRHGTIRPTFIFTPKRGRVLLAKLVSSTLLGAAFGLLTEGLAFGTGILLLWARGADTVLSMREFLLVALGSVGVTALMAALGVGLGAVVRNQVLAVIGLTVWFMVVENVVVAVAPSVGRFFPLAAGDALGGVNSTDLLTAPQGAAVLTGYVVAFFLAGLIITKRSDVR